MVIIMPSELVVGLSMHCVYYMHSREYLLYIERLSNNCSNSGLSTIKTALLTRVNMDLPTCQLYMDNSKKSQPLADLKNANKAKKNTIICGLSLSTWFSDTHFLARETRASARRPLTSPRAVQFRNVSNDDSELWFAIVCLPGDSTKVFH